MISAVVPAFNEEGNLAPGIADLAQALASAAAGAYEIVVVDDGSTDGTARELAALCADPRVRAVRLPVNRGKGAALKAGVAATSGDPVLICDADMATPPALLPRFLEALASGAEVAIGSRRLPGSTTLRAQSRTRVALGRAHTHLVNLLFGGSVSDYTCGFKLFRGDAARRLFAQCRSQRWGYDVEVLVLARHAGLRVREVPVDWRDGPRSRVSVVPAVLTTLGELARLRLRRPRQVRLPPSPGTR
jgi:dolichyl-phosphate beta-glucosyltransferase